MSRPQLPLVAETARQPQPALQMDTARPARLGLWLIGVVFIGGLLWAALAPLDQGVPVSGSITVAGNRQAVQHLEGGQVKRLLVAEGERVSAGQLLLQLDDTTLQAQVASLRSQYLAAAATESRLTAERDEQPLLEFPQQLLAASTDHPQLDALLALQQQLFHSRRQTLALELAALNEAVAGSNAQLRGQQALQRNRQQQLTSLTEQLTGLRRLASAGYIPRNRLLDSEREYAELAGRVAEDGFRISQLHRQVSEMTLRHQQRQQEYQQDVRSQLAEVHTQANDLSQRLHSAEFALAHTRLTAPMDGSVVNLSIFTEGGVVAPGQVLMEIVPDHQPLVVEARVPVHLIDKVHPGLPVELIFSAFNQTRTPRIPATVEMVAADRQHDEQTGESFYTLRASVTDVGAALLKDQTLRPGMPVEAFVRTGERSLLNYLFKPLLDRFHLALAEE